MNQIQDLLLKNSRRLPIKGVWLVVALSAFSVAGCSTWDKLDNKERGAVIGGGTGAVLGSAVSPGVGGAVIGGGVGALGGGLVGNEMDKNERRRR